MEKQVGPNDQDSDSSSDKSNIYGFSKKFRMLTARKKFL